MQRVPINSHIRNISMMHWNFNSTARDHRSSETLNCEKCAWAVRQNTAATSAKPRESGTGKIPNGRATSRLRHGNPGSTMEWDDDDPQASSGTSLVLNMPLGKG